MSILCHLHDEPSPVFYTRQSGWKNKHFMESEIFLVLCTDPLLKVEVYQQIQNGCLEWFTRQTK